MVDQISGIIRSNPFTFFSSFRLQRTDTWARTVTPNWMQLSKSSWQPIHKFYHHKYPFSIQQWNKKTQVTYYFILEKNDNCVQPSAELENENEIRKVWMRWLEMLLLVSNLSALEKLNYWTATCLFVIMKTPTDNWRNIQPYLKHTN